ncbi:hypothetical protein AB0K16_22230 [Nonomuraea jabiensis]|uniref:hypothetical protein n=1 Tax=Nonomuraea jabiensis TaxID=882448 RepID=UPI00342203ED
MSNIKFRAAAQFTPIGGDTGEWRCEHKHEDIRTAGKCGQLYLRRFLPIGNDKKSAIRWESTSTSILVHDPAITPGDSPDAWMDLSFYRMHVNRNLRV